MRPIVKRYVIPSVLLLAVLLPLLAACGAIQRDRSGVPDDLEAVWEAYRTIQERYVDREALDPDELSEGAIRGMLEVLDDPFITYLDPSDFRAVRNVIQGTFEGIGATVAMEDGFPTIVAPMPDSPADRAGLRTGDVIREVEGESIEGLTLQEVVEKIRGPKGTPVSLRIQRAGAEGLTGISIVRDEIRLASVSAQMLDDDIARVRVTQFVSNTSEELLEVLEDLRERNVRGIVLDLTTRADW